MRWRLRFVAGLIPWCAVAVTLALLVAIELRWTPVDGPAGQYVRADQPFVEHDPGGASLVCVSNRAGRILPPYLAP